ncbi:MAG: HlyC/CorC family transporter [Desulfobulbaceae bacterium]|nr:MAG: HlyC/CorC family transporter [Desulfobulbaceae bacterium]
MEIFLLFCLILLNGAFAMSEIAVISSRNARLQKLANDGNLGARSALDLKNEPSSFLSTVQVGITMVGILSGAIGETALADPLAAWLGGFPVIAPYARGVAMTAVVVGLTYFSVVVGELVPKRMGLLAPEKTASIIALPMKLLSRIAIPLVWLLSVSSNLLLRLLRKKTAEEPPVTNSEIRLLMAQGTEAGVFHASEQTLVANVLRLDEQNLRAIMTPRNELYLLDLNTPEPELRISLAGCPFSRIVICRGGLENILGLLRTADLLRNALVNEPLEIESLLYPPLYMWEGLSTAQVLENFRKTNLQCALIVDEYGELQGLVTLTDVLTAIVGGLPSASEHDVNDFIERQDGSWLVDGAASIEHLRMKLDIGERFPGEKQNAYFTVGGLVIHLLGRVPAETDAIEENGYHFEVVDMDGHRVDKVLVSKVSPE